MDGHLVAVEVGVEGRAHQRVKLDLLAFDQHWLERLDAETVKRRRGYNQSVELARALHRIAGLRVEANWARRVRRTDGQIGMTDVARRRNVAKAFVVDPKVRGLRIAPLDDVMTTGATPGEIARSGLTRTDVGLGQSGSGRL